MQAESEQIIAETVSNENELKEQQGICKKARETYLT